MINKSQILISMRGCEPESTMQAATCGPEVSHKGCVAVQGGTGRCHQLSYWVRWLISHRVISTVMRSQSCAGEGELVRDQTSRTGTPWRLANGVLEDERQVHVHTLQLVG